MRQITGGTDRKQIERPVFRGLSYRENSEAIRVLLVITQQGFVESKRREEIACFVTKKIGGPGEARPERPRLKKAKWGEERGKVGEMGLTRQRKGEAQGKNR